MIGSFFNRRQSVPAVIADFTNATHDHEDAAGGGTVALLKPAGDSTSAVQIQNAAGTASVLIVDTLNKRIGIGTLPAFDTALHILSQSSSQPRGICIDNYTDTTSAGSIMLRKARGAPGTPATIHSGDGLGAVCFSGYSGGAAADGFGNTTTHAAIIQALASENWGVDANGCDMTFTVTPNGGEGAADYFVALHLDNGGNVGIGTTDPQAKLHLKGTTSCVLEVEATGDTSSMLYLQTNNVLKAMVGYNAANDALQLSHREAGTGVGNYDLVVKAGLTGFGVASPQAKLHADQYSATGAIPVLLLDQGDDDQALIEFTGTVGVGNCVEPVGEKALTTTHFIKCTLTGVGTVYLPVGTIA